jgi:GTP-binding protein
LSAGQVKSNLQVLRNKLLEEWEELPPVILTSAFDRSGRQEILDYIFETNRLFVRD